MQTFTGFEYIKIDIANAFGMDKELFEARIAWVDTHIDELEGLIDKADDAPLFLAGVMALRAAQNGQPTGHMVGLDACSSGLQIMGTLIGDPETCTNTGLIDPTTRADIYTHCTAVMNDLLKQHGVSVAPARKDVKQALMTHFYGSNAKPKEIFGEDTVELECFYQAQATIAPGAVDVMDKLLESWQPFELSHEWVLPDGFEAKCKVMDAVDVKVEIDELDHMTFTHRFYENVGTESGLSIAANIVHSIDGMLVREMNRRCNYNPAQLTRVHELLDEYLQDIEIAVVDTSEFVSLKLVDEINHTNLVSYSFSTLIRLKAMIEKCLTHKPFPVVCVHDEFKCHPNNMQRLRETYRDMFCELADSELLSDLLSQVRGYHVHINKFEPNLSTYIANSNYALS